MTIEEKARRYDEAIIKAKALYGQPLVDNTLLETIIPELKESDDERIRKALIENFKWFCGDYPETTKWGKDDNLLVKDIIVWLEKQGEQKPTQEIEPFEAEHGKYYYCIKDYFCGGKKQASKGDVIQALRGLPIMGLEDASEYFLPVNTIEKKSVWSEDDNKLTDVNHEYFSELLENDDSKNINDYAYQVAYCMSHDWMEETATWDDAQKACKLGAKWNEKHHKSAWSKEDEEMFAEAISVLLSSSCSYDDIKKVSVWLRTIKQRMGG